MIHLTFPSLVIAFPFQLDVIFQYVKTCFQIDVNKHMFYLVEIMCKGACGHANL
jgi:hypothetical protein